MVLSVYLDVYAGDKEEHARESAAYSATAALLAKNAAIYGLPDELSELSDEQREILQELDVFDIHSSLHGLATDNDVI